MKTFEYGQTPDQVIRDSYSDEITYNFSDKLHSIIENALIFTEKYSIFQVTEADKVILLDVEDMIGLLDALTEYSEAEKEDSSMAKDMRRAILKAMEINETD
jgi:hypothetical protein